MWCTLLPLLFSKHFIWSCFILLCEPVCKACARISSLFLPSCSSHSSSFCNSHLQGAPAYPAGQSFSLINYTHLKNWTAVRPIRLPPDPNQTSSSTSTSQTFEKTHLPSGSGTVVSWSPPSQAYTCGGLLNNPEHSVRKYDSSLRLGCAMTALVWCRTLCDDLDNRTDDDSQPFMRARYTAKHPGLNPNISPPRLRRHVHETQGSPSIHNTYLVPPGVCGAWPLLAVWDPRFSRAHPQYTFGPSRSVRLLAAPRSVGPAVSRAHRQPTTHIWSLLVCAAPGRSSQCGSQPTVHIWSLLECAAPGRSSQCGTRGFPGLTANPQPP